jgi:AcrR family transcriptional regulator
VTSPVKRLPRLRAEQAANTRQRIIEAASAIFAERGFAGARIEDVADAAGVAVPTVYKVFSNKRNLLGAVVNWSMTGGDTDAGVDSQTWWTEQLEEPDPVRQLELVARNARRIYERSATALEALRAASPLDPEMSRLWEEISADRFRRSRRTAKRLVAKAGTRSRQPLETTALTLCSLTAVELYSAHVAADRTADQYERWLADVLCGSLLNGS